MLFFLVMLPVIGAMADSFVQETSNGLQTHLNITFQHIPTEEFVPESPDDYSRAICPWTFTIDDNIHRIPRRIMVMDETHGLPSTCNGNNMSANFTCESIRRKMKVLWKTQCSDERCVLEERTITVSVGLTCVQTEIPDNQELNRSDCRGGETKEKKGDRIKGKDCKVKKSRRCRKFCKEPYEKSMRCLNCKQKRKRTI